jgi:DNA-binding CsgD family transcriptional regulator/PAS domain-containing protein
MSSSAAALGAGATSQAGQVRDATLEARASEIMASLTNLRVPFALADIPGMRIRAANEPLLALAGMRLDELLGWAVIEFSPPDRRAAARSDQESIANGRLEGFQAGRVFHLPNGRTIEATVWARRLVVDGEPWAAGIVLPAGEADGGLSAGFSAPAAGMMMAVTDHLWVIEYASADARRVVGLTPDALMGVPLLDLVHADDRGDFMAAVTAATTSGTTIVCTTRLSSGNGGWRSETCFVTPLCAHTPPRLGLAVARATDRERAAAPERQARQQTLEQTLWRIAMELRAAGITADDPVAITHGPPSRAAQLSGRQWEVVQRLSQGQDAAAIAKAMYLSPSTVRNHLVAVYRKFGVHSQVQLLATMRDDNVVPAHEGEPC